MPTPSTTARAAICAPHRATVRVPVLEAARTIETPTAMAIAPTTQKSMFERMTPTTAKMTTSQTDAPRTAVVAVVASSGGSATTACRSRSQRTVSNAG